MSRDGSKGSGVERRKHKRVEFKESILAHPVHESKSGNVYEVGESSLTVKSMDVSEGGLRVMVSQPLDAGKILKINLPSPKSKMTDIYTRIAWANGALCGLQFIVLDESTRQFIRGYVEKSF
ncbi:MAG TPA: PilZ domain-containing protein [bacterium]|nr:PilZ domain-containing protein [bacterium]